MLLNVPAVASTTGTATSVTWRSDALYTYTGKLRIYGRFVSGTFTDGETVTQAATGATAVVSGAQSTGIFLLVTAGTGVPVAGKAWVGGSSAAVFEPTEEWKFPQTLFVYISIYGKNAFTLPVSNDHFVLEEAASTAVKLKLIKNPQFGATLKFLDCVVPTFTVPQWARSFSIQNISAADMFFRAYRPNVSAQLIDTSAAGLSDNTIVGTKLTAGQSVGFPTGDFSPGCSFMLVATVAATGGAIVEFSN